MGRLANIGVKIVGSSVASRDSSPRFVREGDPVNAEWDKSQKFQVEMHKLTNDIPSTGKLAEALEIMYLNTGSLKFLEIAHCLYFATILHNVHECEL
jgi:hypothetical protein